MAGSAQTHASRSEIVGRPTATLDQVDIRRELEIRPCRPPNYAQEDRAYGTLAREMAENPRNLLQKLVDVAVELCAAGTLANDGKVIEDARKYD